MNNFPSRHHLIPIDDWREHVITPQCWCRPTPDEEHDIWVHHSMDGREAFNSGERLPS